MSNVTVYGPTTPTDLAADAHGQKQKTSTANTAKNNIPLVDIPPFDFSGAKRFPFG
jgi:hypothetical protein